MILRKLKQWVGIPAPEKLQHDDWFPVPEELKEPEPVVFEDDVIIGEVPEVPEVPAPIEPDKLHEWTYQEATKNASTTLDLNPPGGSENLHGDGWQSGTGMGQFR